MGVLKDLERKVGRIGVSERERAREGHQIEMYNMIKNRVDIDRGPSAHAKELINTQRRGFSLNRNCGHV